MRVFASVQELAGTVGEVIGQSEWVTVGQDDIDLFGRATGDLQWIHVDPAAAAKGPFGTTIAHGFLTLALLPRMWATIYTVQNIRMGVNYGLNKVRFPSPVPVDSRLRAESTLVAADEVAPGTVQVTLATTIEIEGSAKPACVAESVVRFIL